MTRKLSDCCRVLGCSLELERRPTEVAALGPERLLQFTYTSLLTASLWDFLQLNMQMILGLPQTWKLLNQFSINKDRISFFWTFFFFSVKSSHVPIRKATRVEINRPSPKAKRAKRFNWEGRLTLRSVTTCTNTTHARPTCQPPPLPPVQDQQRLESYKI